MKASLISLLAATLLGVASLFAKDYVAGSPVRLRVDLDREVLPADSTERAVVKIGLDCVKLPPRAGRPPVNLALVIDRSGSMSGEKIAKAREAALELVRQLGPDDIISIVAYDSGVEVLAPAQRVGRARGLEEAICSIEAGGNTALHGGVVRGAAEVRRHAENERYVHRVILLSDGQANVGPSSPEELGRLGASLVKEGIAVTTIGLGLGFNEDLMTRLAERSDGNTYFVEDSADLPRIFAAELGDVLNVVARRVVIEIEFPEGVRPLNFVGREGTIRGQRAELTLNQLYGGQEKFALVEVEVAPGRAGSECEVARAEVRFEDAVNQRAARLRADRKVKFSRDERTVVASANHQVQAEFAANALAAAKDQAVALADAGRRDEAAAVIRQRADEMRKVAETYRNAALAAEAPAAAAEADRLEQEGLSNEKRKSYRAEAVQVRNQQALTSDRP
ncbi:MAG TPA: VWA domain-containing protein [Opitutaceae bacterium]|nr:VWA domain-containing protein [Opitutaceae bacterium]